MLSLAATSDRENSVWWDKCQERPASAGVGLDQCQEMPSKHCNGSWLVRLCCLCSRRARRGCSGGRLGLLLPFLLAILLINLIIILAVNRDACWSMPALLDLGLLLNLPQGLRASLVPLRFTRINTPRSMLVRLRNLARLMRTTRSAFFKCIHKPCVAPCVAPCVVPCVPRSVLTHIRLCDLWSCTASIVLCRDVHSHLDKFFACLELASPKNASAHELISSLGFRGRS